VDEAVRVLAEGVASGTALVALGGYGRQSLCPASDIDLMVLHRERRPERVRQVAERLFYPFWDAGLRLGHAVRTIGDCVRAFSDRLDTATSLLDARLVWGDEELVADLRHALTRAMRRDPNGLLRRLREGRAVRHRTHGSCSQLMEPDLKESTGGLRDIHTVGWVGRAIGGFDDEDLHAELLRSTEVAALEEAEEFLVRLRSALHLESQRPNDRLFFEHQAFIAETFGFEDTAGIGAADALMRGLFQHARNVEHVALAALDRGAALLGAGDRPQKDAPQPSSPEEAMLFFARAATEGKHVHPVTQDAIEEADLGEPPYRWTEVTRQAFLELLAAGDGGERALEAMDRMGLLVEFLPEWEAVRCRPQRDPYHLFTVDVHLMRTVAEAARLLFARGGRDPVTEQAVAGVRDRDAVLLGAFLHDIGKTGEGPHVETGVRIARAVLERMGTPAETSDHVHFLVRQHLLLSDTATRRDLSDENLVLDVAAAVETPERLAMLYVLTVADAVSTGPHAWTPWRQALIRELVAKVEHILERGDVGPDEAEQLQARIADIRRLLAEESPEAVDRYVARLPRPYVLTVTTETAARHFRLLSPRVAAAEVRTAAWPGERLGTYDLTVVAPDRPGLLAKIAGTLALNGLNILSARAFTTEDGVALDLFVVEGLFDQEVDEEGWRRVRTDLRKALEGRISLDHRVREKRRHYPRPRASVPTAVNVDNGASDFFTVVEVSAPDRIGLLFEVARVFHELDLDVHVAKVATYGERVVDAFYLRDLFGAKLEDPEHMREIEQAVLARLTEDW
jgi:[protein-PII] uridylyltransferase